MRSLDRLDAFPRSGQHELSLLSWNVLAEEYYKDYSQKLDWQAQRWPLLRQWLLRFTACDVLCFQEIDRARMLGPMQELMAKAGFDVVVQDRGDFPVVNAVFFQRNRLSLSWVDHRSRVLLVGLALPDGRQVGLVNVHLEAGNAPKNEEQRKAQVTSALRRVRSRNPWCVAVCGDFNSKLLKPESVMPDILAEAGLSKVPSSGFTFLVHDHVDTYDHIWAGEALRAEAVLGSDTAAFCGCEDVGLPNDQYPSDHLPVAAIFRVASNSAAVAGAEAEMAPAPPALATPACLSVAVREEWLQIRRLAESCDSSKASRKQQKRLEAAFLATLDAEERAALCTWQAAAAHASRLAVAAAVAAACAALDASGACVARNVAEAPQCLVEGPKPPLDPGGELGRMVPWQGG